MPTVASVPTASRSTTKPPSTSPNGPKATRATRSPRSRSRPRSRSTPAARRSRLADAEAALSLRALQLRRRRALRRRCPRSSRASAARIPTPGSYWLARMLEAGEDARFIARRLVILASEDIGLADPHVAARRRRRGARRRVRRAARSAAQPRAGGDPPRRSRRSRTRWCAAIGAAIADVRDQPAGRVPAHLRDAHYPGAARLGHGDGLPLSPRRARWLGRPGVPASGGRREDGISSPSSVSDRTATDRRTARSVEHEIRRRLTGRGDHARSRGGPGRGGVRRRAGGARPAGWPARSGAWPPSSARCRRDVLPELDRSRRESEAAVFAARAAATAAVGIEEPPPRLAAEVGDRVPWCARSRSVPVPDARSRGSPPTSRRLGKTRQVVATIASAAWLRAAARRGANGEGETSRMRRTFWLAAGFGLGLYAGERVRRTVVRLTPETFSDRIAHHGRPGRTSRCRPSRDAAPGRTGSLRRRRSRRREQARNAGAERAGR